MFPSFSARAVGLTGLSAADTVALAARAGFAGVDLLIGDLVHGGEDPAEVRRLMDRHQLRGGAWHLPVRWRGDAATFAADLAELPRLAAAAQTLGLHRTGTAVLVETIETSDPDPIAATVRFHHDRLGPVARILADHGTRLGLEVVGARSFRTGRGLPFVDRLTDLERRLGSHFLESNDLGVLVDAFHLYAAGESVADALSGGADRVVWVHVADLPAGASRDRAAIFDSDRGLPGEHGAVETPLLFDHLARTGYDGPVTAETLAGCRSLQGLSPDEVAVRTCDTLRTVWPSGRWP